MINKIRILLRDTLLYEYAAFLYHLIRNLFFRFLCFLEGVSYFSPLKPVNEYKSQFGQDRILELMNLLNKGGVFVEVGSNHPIYNSNSYYLEIIWRYSGISIDPIDYSSQFQKYRPNTKFINSAVDNSQNFVEINFITNSTGWEDQVTSMYDNVLSHGRGFNSKKINIKASPLSDLCDEIDHIDLLLLDVEGHELNVLDSINWHKHRPSVILTENSGEYYPKCKLRNYLESKKYSLKARIGASDEIYIDNQN